MYETIRVAAVSLRSRKWDKQANADKMERFFRDAAASGAQLIVAPEGVLEGDA